MESSKSTENLTSRVDNGNSNPIHLALIIIAIVIAIVALIVACVGMSQKGTTQIVLDSNSAGSSAPITGGGSGAGSDDKIWSIAIGHSAYNLAYIDDESGTLKGFFVDLTNAVCRIANRNCKVVYDIWNRCWDSEEGQVARGGIGLMGGWYDACAGWVGTYDRYRTYDFSEPFSKLGEPSLFVKPGSQRKYDWKDMRGKKIGILDGWSTDEFCLKRNRDKFTQGVPLTADQIVHYHGPPDLVKAVKNDEVDYAFLGQDSLVGQELERVDGDPILPCSIHGNAMMLRKVDQAFLDWYNPAQKQLIGSREYETICQDLLEEHGHLPGQKPEDYCIL